MGACGKGVSQFVLLTVNTLIFLIAAGGLGVSIYVFYDTAAKALTHMSLLMAVFIASIVLMFFSCLGCKTALNPPSKKCSRCMYLSILMVLFILEFVAAGYIFNLGHALEVAKEHHYDVEGGVNKAAEDALVFLHSQLTEFYNDENCTGGESVGYPTLPFNFTTVTCKSNEATQGFAVILKDNTITTAQQLAAYDKCTKDQRFTYDGSSATFTQTFCGSEEHIVSLAQKYSHYLVWFPVALAALTFILFVATLCVIANNRRQIREQQQQRAPLVDHQPPRVQMRA